MMVRILVFFFALIGPLHAEKIETIKVGSKAPDFTLKNVDGQMVSLADFSDRQVIVVIFTCNHCPDARAARGRIKQLHADFKGKGEIVFRHGGEIDAIELRRAIIKELDKLL